MVRLLEEYREKNMLESACERTRYIHSNARFHIHVSMCMATSIESAYVIDSYVCSL